MAEIFAKSQAQRLLAPLDLAYTSKETPPIPAVRIKYSLIWKRACSRHRPDVAQDSTSRHDTGAVIGERREPKILDGIIKFP